VDPQGLGDDAGDGPARIQRGKRILKNHLHIFSKVPQFFALGLNQVDAIKKHLSCSRAVELNESAPGGGFSAAAFAYQSQGFSFLDIK